MMPQNQMNRNRKKKGDQPSHIAKIISNNTTAKNMCKYVATYVFPVGLRLVSSPFTRISLHPAV
jgi:hypothetical protein